MMDTALAATTMALVAYILSRTSDKSFVLIFTCMVVASVVFTMIAWWVNWVG